MKRVVGSLIVVSALLVGCARKEKPVEAAAKPADPLMVRTIAAESRVVDRAISVTGSLAPDETASVSSEVPGRVARILVDFGQPFKKGQVLIELDRQELEFSLARAKSALAQAVARLGVDPSTANPKPESTAAMRQASAQMEDAKTKYDNARKLVSSGDISQERFNELEKTFNARQAAYEAVRDEMRTQVVSLDALRADVNLATKRLNDATVRAPFDGSVSQKLVSPGQYAKENTPLLNIVKNYPLRLRIEVPETASGTLKAGSTVEFTTDAVPGEHFAAVIREINPSLDEKSRSLTAEARLTKNDSRLRPGMFVQVLLKMSRNSEVVAVPKQAVYTVAGLTKVFVIRNGKAVELRISPGQDLGTWVEVPRDAVNAGEPVAISGLNQLVNGTPVRTTPGKLAAAVGLAGAAQGE